MVVETINNVGYAVTQTLVCFLRVNNFIGENAIGFICMIFNHLRRAVIALCTATYIMLEDLAIFIAETTETFVQTAELIHHFVDQILLSIFNGYVAVKCSISWVCEWAYSGLEAFCGSIVCMTASFGRFLNLLWTTILFLIGLVPRTLYLVTLSIISSLKSLSGQISDLTFSFFFKVSQAPFESVIGLIGFILIFVSVRRLIKRSNLTMAQGIQLLLRFLCVFYLYVLTSLIVLVRCIFRTVEFTLSHLHVTRFHHEGDSDAEEDQERVGDIGIGSFDESDENENERMDQKRRNYNLLLKRRSERQKKSKRLNIDSDVEEMLFEQVEREREDKLCVVCQDKEKCIMILPCRHLCICQDCQELLRLQNHHCPICRKNVRQTVKVYL